MSSTQQFPVPASFTHTRSEIGIFKYPLGESWFLAFPFVLTATPLILTLAIAIACKCRHHIHTNSVTRQRARLERIWQISSTRF